MLASSFRPVLAALCLAAALGCTSSARIGSGGDSTDSTDSALRTSNIQLIRTVEDHRLVGDKRLAAFLSNSDAATRGAAAIAIGRIGDASLEAQLVPLASESSPTVRRDAAFALGLLGDSTAESAIAAQLKVERDAPTEAVQLLALGQAGTASSLPFVTGALASSTDSLAAAAAEAYGEMVRRGVPPSGDPAVAARLIALAGGPDASIATPAAYALSKLGAAKVALDEPSLTAAFASAQTEARGYLVSALGSIGTSTAVATLATASAADTDANVRSAATNALAANGATPAVLAALTAALNDPADAVAVEAANNLANLGPGAASTSTALSALFDASASAWVRSAALNALVSVAPAAAHSRELAGLNDVWAVQLVAIADLPAVATSTDVTTLVALAANKDLRIASAAVGAISYLPATLIDPTVMKPAMQAALARNDWELTLQVCGVAATFGWTDFASTLNALYAQYPGDTNANARLGIVWALGYVGGSADLPLLQSALQDNLVMVAQQAAQSYQQLTGTNVMAQARTQNVVTTQTPSPGDIRDALDALVLMDTTRGSIAIKLVKDAPLNATQFVSLAQSGFYNGLPFHRVVPNWVAQGGDPRGDGYGGTTLVRDEDSLVPHYAGAVGMATAGNDTGSCQLFVDKTWNVRLDQHYTVFGQVVEGLDVAQSLEVGDAINSATVIPGAGKFF